jgi:hypothetical protein
MPLLHQGRNLVLLCVCKDYDQCHRKLVFDLLTLSLTDSLRPPQQMCYEPIMGLYQGITSDALRHVSVVPDIFDWNRDLPCEELYDPNGWASEADGEHAWVEWLEETATPVREDDVSLERLVLTAALRQLPASTRTLLLLSAQGYSATELARAQGLHKATLARHLASARVELSLRMMEVHL